jgi:hypothetical protein
MKQNTNTTEIEYLFQQFLNENSKKDKDLEYGLLQSTVEPIIRFKFGSWLNKYFDANSRLNLNLMEANRLDLAIGIDDQIYFIEFGHLLNILKHKADLNKSKIAWDAKRIVEKAGKLKSKINNINSSFTDGKKVNYLTCSLFSEFKMKEIENKFQVKLDSNPLKTGTLFKYGKSFNNKIYYSEYPAYLNKHVESEYLYGYTEAIIIPDKLSLHYKFDTFEL